MIVLIDGSIKLGDVCGLCPRKHECKKEDFSSCKARMVRASIKVRDWVIFCRVDIDVEFEF